jgi:aryl-alcohol dehydrogenase-like predicted oxidoreductase
VNESCSIVNNGYLYHSFKTFVMTAIKKIALGHNGPMVSKLGLGCMRMSATWGPHLNDDNESIATIHEALDNGINFINTGDFTAADIMNCWLAKHLKAEGMKLLLV